MVGWVEPRFLEARLTGIAPALAVGLTPLRGVRHHPTRLLVQPLIELRCLPGEARKKTRIAVEAIRGGRSMRTLHVQSQSGSDGVIHLDIPAEAPNANYDIVVVLQPRPDVSTTTADRDWPPGFFEATADAWQGEFVRDQGQFEERQEF